MKKYLSIMSKQTKLKCIGVILLAFFSSLLASIWPVKLGELYTNISNGTILTIRIKVSKNDYRIFNLKKYDDLFISIQKFFDLNQIKSELIRPTVIKIFSTLNKIFSLCNSKIGIYDQQYLKTLYKICLKNGKNIPKYKEEEGDSSLSEDSNKESKSYQAENSLENNDNNRQDTAKSY